MTERGSDLDQSPREGDDETIELRDDPAPSTGTGSTGVMWPDAASEEPPAPAEPPSFWEPPAEPTPRRSGGGRGLALFLAALLGAGLGGGGAYLALDGGRGVATVRVAPPVDTEVLPGSENTAATVAAAVSPSIVQVDVASAFADGLGSGVIYSSDGFIITNEHVVSGAREVVVNLADGQRLPAAVVGSARNVGVDIAVLKVVPTEPLAAATFGSSRDVRVGELAVAIGSPFGLQGTVTSGIISALHRNQDLGGGVRFTDAIQTDAAINQGNSGGALANSRGEVIGINTAILGGGGGGNVGVGFAIPIDIARKVADQIIETGSAQLAFMGISGDNLAGEEGARVREVTPGGGAEEAGVRPGDVIVEFDGETVTSMDELISFVLERDVGQTVKVIIIRDGDRQTLDVTLGARPES